MKNIILIILLSFVAFSCSKDENNEPKVHFPEYLIGKWKMVDCLTYDDSSVLEGSPCNIQTTKNTYDIWFKENGLYFSKSHLYFDDNLVCDDVCSYIVEEAQIYPDREGGFIITLKPDKENGNYKIPIMKQSQDSLILNFGYRPDNSEVVTYTRVE